MGPVDLRLWILADIEQLRFSYRITAGAVPKEKWSVRPRDDANSVGFLVWHMARWHDLAVNVFVLDTEQVFMGGWQDRIGVGPEPGTGFTTEQVNSFGRDVDPVELEAYFHAVLDRTQSWVSEIPNDEFERVLGAPVDTDAAWSKCMALLPPAASWVPDFQRGWDAATFLRWTAFGHLHWHFGELLTVTTAIGYPVA